MRAREILRDWLQLHDYDGLYSDRANCGCVLDDICPCDGEWALRCLPGINNPRIAKERGCDYWIEPRKDG